MHYFRKAVPWIVFIVLAFAIPASAVRMREGRSSHCQHGCFYLIPAASKWPSLKRTSRQTQKAAVLLGQGEAKSGAYGRW
jgi:hypothetical protein